MPGFLRLAAGGRRLCFREPRSLSMRRRNTSNVRIILRALTSVEHAIVAHDAHDAMTNRVSLGEQVWFKLLGGTAVAPGRQQCKSSRIVDAREKTWSIRSECLRS